MTPPKTSLKSTRQPIQKKTPRRAPKTPTKIPKPPLSTRENLSALITSARNILRKDKGLSGDADRLPLLTWVMFLKFLDDLEIRHEAEAALDGKPWQPIIDAPYRWRDWAARADGITGDELLAFIAQEHTTRPNGSAGPGLFAWLRGLSDALSTDNTGAPGHAGSSRRDVIANVFKSVQNRMVSGYLLRDILNKINGVHFNAREEIHTLSHLYETMLREMRDAAGDAGEFYTPRPVVRFMVQATNPQLGEAVLDPACGTGGFLVEAYDHLAAQVRTTEDRHTLQCATLFGQEAKPLPYMLAQMNLLLHGLETPQIAYGNTLERRINEIGHSERVDVILSNPPFGGEEETGIRHNFPPDMQTSETALLFLQFMMRKLRVAGASVKGKPAATRGGRAAVVVPNGVLFGDGVAAAIKAMLLKDFNLHTIVRLPQGVFAPYTDIPANLLFFERAGTTNTIWYYELPAPQGRKKYSKTAPLPFDAFAPVLTWWNGRHENAQAWKVSANEIIASGYNLDRKNPHAGVQDEHADPQLLIENMRSHEDGVARLLKEIQTLAQEGAVFNYVTRWPKVVLGEVLHICIDAVPTSSLESVNLAGIYGFGRGLFKRGMTNIADASYKKYHQLHAGDFVISTPKAWEGAISRVDEKFDGWFLSPAFPTFRADAAHLDTRYLDWYCKRSAIWQQLKGKAKGMGARRETVSPEQFLSLEIPLPPLPEQKALVACFDALAEKLGELRAHMDAATALLPAMLERVFTDHMR